MNRAEVQNIALPTFCRQRGFTLTELITVIVILGILSAVALPRFFSVNTFDSRGFYDQTITSLRYAQKAAIAQHRYVCVTVAANTLTLTWGTTTACSGGNLPSPSGQSAYSVSAPSGVTVSNAAFYFDALGKPGSAQSITVSGNSSAITVEAETGYVH
jgi:MSHA pilin protein MshC